MGMRDRARVTAARVDKKLAIIELQLLIDTAINTAELSPNITSHESYNDLISIINEATQANHNVALLEEKINALGSEGWKLARKIIEVIK